MKTWVPCLVMVASGFPEFSTAFFSFILPRKQKMRNAKDNRQRPPALTRNAGTSSVTDRCDHRGDKGRDTTCILRRYPRFKGIRQANACILWKKWPLCLMAEANEICGLKYNCSDPVNAVSPNPPTQ